MIKSILAECGDFVYLSCLEMLQLIVIFIIFVAVNNNILFQLIFIFPLFQIH